MQRRMSLWIVALVLLAAAKGLAADGGGYRGPDRNGVYPQKGLLKRWPECGPRPIWKFERLGDGWSSVTVVNKTVYVLGGASPGHLFSFTLDGELKYREPYGREFQKRFNGSRATVEIKDGKAVFSSGVGVIYCCDAATGKTLWSLDTVAEFKNQVPGWGYNVSPLIVDDRVVFSIRRGVATTVAADLATGKTVWANEASTFAIADSSPILARPGKTPLIVDSLWSATIAADPADGRIVWKDPMKSGSIATPVWAEGMLVASVGGALTAFTPAADGRGFEPAWQGPGFRQIAQIVVLDGKVFVQGDDTQVREVREAKAGREVVTTRPTKVLCLRAFDLKTGKPLKSEPIVKEGSLWAADGMVYMLEGGEGAWQKGEPARTRISLVKPTPVGFEIVSRFEPLVGTKEAWVNAAVAEGRLFIRHGSLIACYDISDPDHGR